MVETEVLMKVPERSDISVKHCSTALFIVIGLFLVGYRAIGGIPQNRGKRRWGCMILRTHVWKSRIAFWFKGLFQ